MRYCSRIALQPKTEEQDGLKALDTSIVNLEEARGGKPDVAIDLTQLFLLGQQEIADAKNDAAEKAREMQAKRLTLRYCHRTNGLSDWPRRYQRKLESSWRSGIPASISRPRHPWTLIRRF